MSEDRFKNRKEALAWLHSKNIQVSQGKFYQDCEAGKITIYQDKTISKFQVAEYGDRLTGQYRQAQPSHDMADRKAKLEVEKLELDVEKARLANRKEDANWERKDEIWAKIAALLPVLRDSLRHQLHVGTAALIHVAAGDPARGPEVYEAAEEMIGRAFNEVTEAGKIEAIFVRHEED